MLECLIAGGAAKEVWGPMPPEVVERCQLETVDNGVVLRIWLRELVPTPPVRPPEPNCGKHHGQRYLDCVDCQALNAGPVLTLNREKFLEPEPGVVPSKLRERTKEEATEIVASLEKTLLGTGPKEERCAECNVAAPAEGSRYTAGWKTLDGRLLCSVHSEAAIRAAGRELRAEESKAARKETPESLHVLLVSILPEGTVPPLWVLREWHKEDAEGFWAVALWAQREHAWAAPITGHEPPPKLAFPAELVHWRDNPFQSTKKPNGKKKVTKKAPTKKRIRTRKARPSDVPPEPSSALDGVT
jgi:hypothetical protein